MCRNIYHINMIRGHGQHILKLFTPSPIFRWSKLILKLSLLQFNKGVCLTSFKGDILFHKFCFRHGNKTNYTKILFII